MKKTKSLRSVDLPSSIISIYYRYLIIKYYINHLLNCPIRECTRICCPHRSCRSSPSSYYMSRANLARRDLLLLRNYSTSCAKLFSKEDFLQIIVLGLCLSQLTRPFPLSQSENHTQILRKKICFYLPLVCPRPL